MMKEMATMGESDERAPIALALAGGGPLGAMYEVGALVALADTLDGIDFNELDIYVGVSVGSLISAGLVNGVSPEKIFHIFAGNDPSEVSVDPELFMPLAVGEFLKRARTVPKLLALSMIDFARSPFRRGFFASFHRLTKAIPAGVFSNAGIVNFVERLLSGEGRTNNFRRLTRKLFIVATDLDSGESVAFGGYNRDHVAISKAVSASAALPGLYPPVEIDGRSYVDGALKKTLHASVALKEGAKLVICINPLVPFNAVRAALMGNPKKHKLVEEGLPAVLSQTFRAIIHSRMKTGLSKYEIEYRDADVILFEPSSDDADIFFTNVFSYRNRRQLVDHAFRKTREDLRARYDVLAPKLASHGVSINRRILDDPHRTLARAVGGLNRHSRRPIGQAALHLSDTLDSLAKLIRKIELRQKAV
jgi:predicted acylesterase/phospholipase RssA